MPSDAAELEAIAAIIRRVTGFEIDHQRREQLATSAKALAPEVLRNPSERPLPISSLPCLLQEVRLDIHA